MLSEFRTRLISAEAESRLLEQLLAVLISKGWLEERSKPRTDSTHGISAIRTLNRLESLGEMLRAALNSIALESPQWLQSWVPQQWYERYSKAVEDYRLPNKKSERTVYGEQIGEDGMELLERLWLDVTPKSLRHLELVERLRKHWYAHFYVHQGQVKLRLADQLPPAGNRLDSPYEPDSRYGNKRSQTRHGYKVHVSETCQPQQVHLITHVQTTPAHIQDIEQTASIHEARSSKIFIARSAFC